MKSTRRTAFAALILVAVAVGVGVAVHVARVHRTEGALLRLPADEIPHNADLTAFAASRGPAVYASHCSQCHGTDLKGDAKRGVPDLQDSVWLYGEGVISDIENTILYGVRSGHPKAHNITDMPAFLRIGQLSPAEITDVVEYVLSLSGRSRDEPAARRGYDLYSNKGNCFDCHSGDALGNPDYGAPALTGPTWVYGGSRETLLKSVTDGRHGLCPAWIDKLSAAQVRELAVYLYNNSKRSAALATARSGQASLSMSLGSPSDSQ
jgi:cytochrome c oxidase cbb3-type subunit 3